MKNKITLDQAVDLLNPKDTLAIPLATGQPISFMNALSNRTDWHELKIFCGLMPFPYPILTNPNVYLTSGYYGPIERFLNEQGANVDYLPAPFRGFELIAFKQPPRVIATTLSTPDEQGYCTFGTHGAAIYNPFVNACHHKDQIAIAEINPQMPRVYGLDKYGDNKIHIHDIDYWFEAENTQIEMTDITPTKEESKIAQYVLELIDDKATLQFGIGAVPDIIAEELAKNSRGGFGIHSELISDGFLKLQEAGKITNQNKGVFQNQSVFTFAFGKKPLYDFLDERNNKNKRSAICLPVSVVNNPHQISKNTNFISINSGLMIDFAGQVCSEAIGLRQYSGVGGQLSFVQGAYESKNGKSILCLKSTANVKGKKVSNITPTLAKGSIISTPRHYAQYIVTEFGIANLFGISDEKRGLALIKIAHPDFREELQNAFEKIKTEYYH